MNNDRYKTKNMNLKYYVLKYFTQMEKVWIST